MIGARVVHIEHYKFGQPPRAHHVIKLPLDFDGMHVGMCPTCFRTVVRRGGRWWEKSDA